MSRPGVSVIFDPASVAVVGASRDRSKRGYQAVARLVEDGFKGAIYPINPEANEIAGVPAYPSLEAVGAEVDLALIARPAEHVVEALEGCGRAGVHAAVVIAVGFRESGESGRQLEQQLVHVAQQHSIRLVGPNTSGVFNTHTGLNLVGVEGVPTGGISVLSQSGNVILGLINEARLFSAVGFASYAGLGNEADVSFDECLAALRDDPDTNAIILYAEGFRNGRALLHEIHRTTQHKPVVVHKAGRSDAGSKSASSHTGALAGSFEVAEAALRQAGAVSVRRSDELLPVAEALALAVPMAGERVAVVADGGGQATMAADALVAHGLAVAPLTEETQAQLRELLGRPAAVGNPVDVAGAADSDPTIFAPVVRAVLADRNIDGVLMVGLFGGYAMRFSEKLADADVDAAARCTEAANAAEKPLIVQSVYAGFKPEAHVVLRNGGVPVYQSIDVAARCLVALRERGGLLKTRESRMDFLPKPSSRPLIDQAERIMLEPEVREILRHYGVPVAPWRLATDPQEAVRAAQYFKTPVALKVVTPDLVHKSDFGGVLLDIDPADAGRAFRQISSSLLAHDPAARLEGVLVSPMAERGLEVIVGMTRDPVFGPAMMLGLGGVMVDVIGGAAFRTLPMTPLEAEELSAEFRSAEVLDGFRGVLPDREALVDLLMKVSDMVTSEPMIDALDLNPVILGESGAVVVDARVVLGSTGARAS